ncbi:hypothetical protein yrohd0001_31350 [Yersinia rohdei ATCC 43380]|nr:hypothetical protein yrohd0001_31350 [Yersinia rohdei ATCC 43380]
MMMSIAVDALLLIENISNNAITANREKSLYWFIYIGS